MLTLSMGCILRSGRCTATDWYQHQPPLHGPSRGCVETAAAWSQLSPFCLYQGSSPWTEATRRASPRSPVEDSPRPMTPLSTPRPSSQQHTSTWYLRQSREDVIGENQLQRPKRGRLHETRPSGPCDQWEATAVVTSPPQRLAGDCSQRPARGSTEGGRGWPWLCVLRLLFLGGLLRSKEMGVRGG